MTSTISTLPQSCSTEQAITWELLIELEPRLLDLYQEARSVRDDRSKPWFCANAVWYGHHGFEGLRPRLVDLVGYRRRDDGSDPRLATSLAYDIAYRTIYNVLPDCRNCSCVDVAAIIEARRAMRRRAGRRIAAR